MSILWKARRSVRSIALAAMACLAVPITAAAGDIHLACNGTGTVERSENVQLQGDAGPVTGYTTHREGVGGEVLVDIVGDGGRIKIPAAFVTVILSRNDHRWLPLNSLRIDDTEIKGRFSLNFLNKPEMTINRTTGHINIGGIGSFSFSGECNAYDVTSGARKF